MDPRQRSRQQMLQGGMPYPGYAQNASIAFSDPWDTRVNSTSASFAPLTSTTMATSADSLSDPYRHNNNTYVPSTYGTSFTSQPATTASSMSGNMYTSQPATTASALSGSLNPTSYSLSGFKGYGYDSDNNAYTIHNARSGRDSLPSLAQPSSDTDLQYDVSRQRQSSLLEYAQRASPSYTFNNDPAVDASRTMLGLSQQAHDRFPMPTSHRNSSSASSGSYYPSSSVGSVSAASSISSTGSYGGYSGYSSIADGNDMGSLSSTDYDSIRPNLPRPSGMIHSQGLPMGAGQNAMMSTFSSRVSSCVQKKHRCRICDKRFTRPSSLQTHMYSHTGEKPFVCGVADCGRAFSVVSNLRRHRKVHKGLSDSDTISNCGSE